eukprot:gene2489-2727_t
MNEHVFLQSLEVLGLKIASKINEENISILSLLKRRLQATLVTVVENNTNRALFEPSPKDDRPDGGILLMTADLLSEESGLKPCWKSVMEQHQTSARLLLRGYLGIAMRLSAMSNRYYTLIVGTEEPHVFANKEIGFAVHVRAILEDRYRLRHEAAVEALLGNLSICTVLFTNVKGYLKNVRRTWQAVEEGRKSSSVDQLRSALKQFENAKASLQEVIHRMNLVAASYHSESAEDKMGGFAYAHDGLVQRLNILLRRLNRSFPTLSLLWTFDLDPVWTLCPNSVDITYLTLFLEGMVLRWVDSCSAVQLTFTFLPSVRVDYGCDCPVNKIIGQDEVKTLKLSETSNDEEDHVAERMCWHCMKENLPPSLQFEQYQMQVEKEDSLRRTEMTIYGLDDQPYRPSDSHSAPICIQRSSMDAYRQGSYPPNRCIQEGHLRILFQPLDPQLGPVPVSNSETHTTVKKAKKAGNECMADKMKDDEKDRYLGQRFSLIDNNNVNSEMSKVKTLFRRRPPGKAQWMPVDRHHDSSITSSSSRAGNKGKSYRRFFSANSSAVPPQTTSAELLYVVNDYLRAIDGSGTASAGLSIHYPTAQDGYERVEAFAMLLPCYLALPCNSATFIQQAYKMRPHQRNLRAVKGSLRAALAQMDELDGNTGGKVSRLSQIDQTGRQGLLKNAKKKEIERIRPERASPPTSTTTTVGSDVVSSLRKGVDILTQGLCKAVNLVSYRKQGVVGIDRSNCLSCSSSSLAEVNDNTERIYPWSAPVNPV